MSLRKTMIDVGSGVKLAAIESGDDGDWICFIPGWTMPAEVWRAQLREFGKSYRTIAISMRSHYGSTITKEGNTLFQYARDIEEARKQIGAEKIHLVAWSLAVGVVWEYLRQFGEENLSSIVLIDGSRFGTLTPDWPHGTAKEKYMHYKKTFEGDRKAFAKSFVKSMFLKAPAEDLEKELIEQSLYTPNKIAGELLDEILEGDYQDIISKTKLPTLILVNEPHKDAAKWASDRIPGSKLYVFSHAGHALMLEDPSWLNEKLHEFLDGLRS